MMYDRLNPNFNYYGSSFVVHKAKDSCGRVKANKKHARRDALGAVRPQRIRARLKGQGSSKIMARVASRI